jgi:hypothetical protein
MPTLSSNSCEWAIEHLGKYSDTDIFPKLFEHQAFLIQKDRASQYLKNKDINQWEINADRQCLVPKQHFGFRIATQLDPSDTTFFTALCWEVGNEIESARIPSNECIAFSNRFINDGTNFNFFDRDINFTSFQAHSAELAKQYPFVVVSDIADFYPRIYLHRLENALNNALAKFPAHSKAIAQFIKQWNQNVSYGIPVGTNASRLLAELVIDEIDKSLQAEGIVFCRFVDDYRIFCKSREEAYQQLTRLANVAFSNAFTLHAQKTKILSAEEFSIQILQTEERRELQSLSEGLDEIFDGIGILNPYAIDLDIEMFDDELKDRVASFNLVGLLKTQVCSDQIDIPMTRFLINRLAWFVQPNSSDVLMTLLNNIDKLYPVLPEVIRYLTVYEPLLSDDTAREIGKFLLNKLDNSVISQLEYHKMMIATLFVSSHRWGNINRLIQQYKNSADHFSRRTFLLALGVANQFSWLREKKKEVNQMPPWERRAFIYSASCLPEDEKKNYYRAINMSEQEKIVFEWSKTSPISFNTPTWKGWSG